MSTVDVKKIRVDRIDSKHANLAVKRWHYSGKVVSNSQLHFGAFYDGKLHGVMSFGPSLDKRKIQGLVRDTGWNGFVELNRMAFDDFLPKNSESRCLSVALKLIKKYAPQIKWVISFADATQSGDGGIYRACGFILTGIKSNKNTVKLPDGSVIHKMTLESNPTSRRPELGDKTYHEITGGVYDWRKYTEYVGGEVLSGYQIRYIYFLDKSKIKNLIVSALPYSEIDKIGAGMYLGRKVTVSSRHAVMV
jgi:hypothetical protein